MFNLCKLNKESENLNSFSKISHKCDFVHLKLTMIYTAKLHPDIMPDDVPVLKNLEISC